MPTRYESAKEKLRAKPSAWLVTGAAGFIGSNLAQKLLSLGQNVVGLDNFLTGKRQNLDEMLKQVGPNAAARFRFIEGDIADLQTCKAACSGVDYVMHQAALPSVPRSINDPLATHRANVDGFMNMIVAARDAKVRRFVYASSSSVYGDSPVLPRVEAQVGRQLSPYAVSKYCGELYANVFANCFGIQTIGLRYFNVFGPRQDPLSPYGGVIPKWISSLLSGTPCILNGDGKTSRDFCYVDNVMQANLLAVTADSPEAINQIYNIGYGSAISLNQLFELIRDGLAASRPGVANARPELRPFRAGDIAHSIADISKARRLLGYEPEYSLQRGLAEALPWYIAHHS
jgi:UDP-N-acetylglucosamine 4-epimerase